jgi:DNA polymerase delta subunit 1
MVNVQGERDPFIWNVFTLDTFALIVGLHVYSCVREADLLDRWAMFLRESDLDIMTKYNIINFILPFLINRARHLNLKNFPVLCRVSNTQSEVKETMIQLKQMGLRENKTTNIEGRVLFDGLWPWYEGEGGSAVWMDKEEEGAPGHVRERGKSR